MKFELQKIREEYLKAVLSGKSRQSAEVLTRSIDSGISASRLYQEVLLWAESDLQTKIRVSETSLSLEIIANEILLADGGRLRTFIPESAPLGLRTAVFGVPGSRTSLLPRALADYFIADGWETEYLADKLPLQEVSTYLQNFGPNVVIIGWVGDDADGCRALIDEIHKHSAGLKTVCVRLSNGNGEASRAIECINTIQEALAIARESCGISDAEGALPFFLKRLGSTVQEIRRERGLSQQQLAELAQLDRAYISSVENGKQNISLGAVAKLARAMGVGLEALLVGMKVAR